MIGQLMGLVQPLKYKRRQRHYAENQVAAWLLPGLLIVLGAIVLVSLSIGAVPISIAESLAIVLQLVGVQSDVPYDASQVGVLIHIRAPRVAMGVIVGAGLAVCGAAMQGMFRNPLADPGLIGVSSGAALAAVAVIVLGSQVAWLDGLVDRSWVLPMAAFCGGLCVTWLVYQLGGSRGQAQVATMLLAGISINAIAGAATGLLTYMADDQQLRTMTFWSMGSLGGASWSQVGVVAPLILVPVLLIPLFAKALNAMLLGEEVARHLGFNMRYLKRLLVILVSMAIGAAVAVSGIIGFVGLVVPHLLRLAMGPDHRWLLPGSALLGASLLLLSDLLARTVVSPAELPIGIVTAILGGPVFLWLLLVQRKRGGL
jgi:iron complex transport system permease protein